MHDPAFPEGIRTSAGTRMHRAAPRGTAHDPRCYIRCYTMKTEKTIRVELDPAEGVSPYQES
jgi:hypothetical protein